MTAEPIASVIADLRTGRVRNAVDDRELFAQALGRVDSTTVVDATAIYASLVANERPVYFYEDHPCIAPPWLSAVICYVNEHGNVVAMQATARRRSEDDDKAEWEGTAEMLDWSAVRWIVDTFVWLGGRSGRGDSIGTLGPVHMWRFAVFAGGQPADRGRAAGC